MGFVILLISQSNVITRDCTTQVTGQVSWNLCLWCDGLVRINSEKVERLFLTRWMVFDLFFIAWRWKRSGPGRTEHIFVYFAKKSVTSSLRQVRPVMFSSTKFCQGLPNFKDAVVLPRSRTNFCQAWNLIDLSIYTPWFEGKCQSRKFDLYF